MNENVITPTTVTLIVPCLNEELNVPRIVARLTAILQTMQPEERNWEVLIVDDGSDDATAEVTRKLALTHPWLHLVRHPRNLGLGAAIRTGLAHAHGDIICTIDSDCTMAPEHLPGMVASVRNGVDMVTASPWHPQSTRGGVHPLRKLLSVVCSRLYRIALRSNYHCYTALLRAHRRQTFEAIQVDSNGFVAVAEMMVMAVRAGYRVQELPITLDRRLLGESKIGLVASIRSHIRLLSKVAWKAWQPHHAPAYKLAE